MARLARAVATLRLMGDDLDPDEITALLGALPTHAHRRGDVLPSKLRGRVADFGMWRLETAETRPADLSGQVHELLGRLTGDLAVWRALAARHDIDLFCGWFLDRANEGIAIPPAALLALGERGIKLDLDIYSGADAKD